MKSLFFLLLLTINLLLSGCGNINSYANIPEKEEDLYETGLKYVKIAEPMNALNAFLKLIEKRRDAPESHFEVGRIYLNDLHDPVAAIYHFRKFLEAKPNVPQSPVVRQMIETAKKDFLKSLPGRNHTENHDRPDLLRLLKESRDENTKLRKIIAQLQTKIPKENLLITNKQPSFAPVTPKKITKIDLPDYYTVQSGDSLSKVSQKIYGSSAYWEKIYLANRDTLPTPHSLKVGQLLKIPSKKGTSGNLY